MDKTAKHPLAVWREAQEAAVTQDEFARRIGTTRWTVNSIETGRRRPSRDMALAIIKATNSALTFDELMMWEPSTPTEQVA